MTFDEQTGNMQGPKCAPGLVQVQQDTVGTGSRGQQPCSSAALFAHHAQQRAGHNRGQLLGDHAPGGVWVATLW